MKKSDRYLKVVEWCEEDQCYIGSAPSLMLGELFWRVRPFQALLPVKLPLYSFASRYSYFDYS